MATIAEIREQIQTDLECILESQFGAVEYLDEVIIMACQAVIDNFNRLECPQTKE